ncbi:MAG: hypothetical protein WD049_08395 [Candidatus Paceibacterota bacterium]
MKWEQIWTPLLVLIVGGVLGYLGRLFLESRRRIRFSVDGLYFGPALSWNLFMGRNYPSDHLIGLECTIRFFSEKTATIGLHDFRLEFCRTTYMGKMVEFTPDMRDVLRDLNDKDTPFTLETLELPPRQFVSLELRTSIDRDHWRDVRLCTVVRLSCKTSEGKTKRFTIGSIQVPTMPRASVNGPEYMSVQMMPLHTQADGGPFVILAARRREGVQTNLFTLPEEDARYWDGKAWVTGKVQAKKYQKPQDARDAGERVKIWNIVPAEWMESDGCADF